MLYELDHAQRCDKHVGEVFRVRCSECDSLAAPPTVQEITEKLDRYVVGADCPFHEGYVLFPGFPCAACEREAGA